MGPESKYFRIGRPDGLSCNNSTPLLLSRNSRQENWTGKCGCPKQSSQKPKHVERQTIDPSLLTTTWYNEQRVPNLSSVVFYPCDAGPSFLTFVSLGWLTGKTRVRKPTSEIYWEALSLMHMNFRTRHNNYSEMGRSLVGKGGREEARNWRHLPGGRELNLSCLSWWWCCACLVGYVVKINWDNAISDTARFLRNVSTSWPTTCMRGAVSLCSHTLKLFL